MVCFRLVKVIVARAEQFADTFETQRKQEMQQRQNRLHQRLQPKIGMSDVLGTYHTLDKTCQWIRDEDEYNRWISGDLSHLWTAGAPGTGKSHLASGIVSQLSQNSPGVPRSTGPRSIAYYFCRKDAARPDTASCVLNTLIAQLARYDNNFLHQASSVFEDLWSSEKELRKQLVKTYFTKPDLHPTCYLIIDGLDEIERPQRDELLAELRSLSELSRSEGPSNASTEAFKFLCLDVLSVHRT